MPETTLLESVDVSSSSLSSDEDSSCFFDLDFFFFLGRGAISSSSEHTFLAFLAEVLVINDRFDI